MINANKDTYIDIGKFEKDLNSLGYIHLDSNLLNSYINMYNNKVMTLSYRCKDILCTKTGYYINNIDRKAILSYLKGFEGVPEHRLENRKTGAESLDASKVIDPLIESGVAVEFLSTYKTLQSIKSKRGLLNSFKEGNYNPVANSNYGTELLPGYFNIAEADNLRYYYNNKNIQSIPRDCKNVITAPMGYTIVSGDLDQADVRIAYNMLLKTKDNFDNMMKYNDAYEAIAREVLGSEFDYNKFKEHRNIYKEFTLAPIYGAGSSSTEVGREFIYKMNDYLAKSPVYQEFCRRLDKKINLDIPLKVSSFFGFTQLIERVKNPYGDLKKQKRNKALNAPIQTGTSEVIILIQNTIMDEFAKLGFTSKSKDIYTYIGRHDEIVFLVKTNLLKDYGYIFQNAQVVHIDGWTPLTMEFTYSSRLGEVDEALTNLAKLSYKEGINDYDIAYSDKDFFIPVKDLFEVTIGTYHHTATNKIFISFYSHIDNKCNFVESDFKGYDEVYNNVLSFIGGNRETLVERDVDTIVINTHMGSKEIALAGMYTKITNNFNNNLGVKANMLAEYACYSYCLDNNIQFNASPELTNNKAFINSILEGGEIF